MKRHRLSTYESFEPNDHHKADILPVSLFKFHHKIEDIICITHHTTLLRATVL